MKKIIWIVFVAVLAGSCKKDDPNTIDPVPDDFNIVDPNIQLPKDAYGILQNAIRNIEIEIPGFGDSIGTAVYGKAYAYFFNNVSDSTFSDAGCMMHIGTYMLTKKSNHAYEYFQGSDDSLIFRNDISWDIACKSIDKLIQPGDFPGRPAITSGKEIFRLSGYTAKNTTISGADSVIYQVQTTTNTRTRTIQKTMPGNSLQCAFTLDELLKLDASNFALLTITGYKTLSDLYAGKKYYSTIQQSTTRLIFVY